MDYHSGVVAFCGDSFMVLDRERKADISLNRLLWYLPVSYGLGGWKICFNAGSN